VKLLLDIDGTLLRLQPGTGFEPFERALKLCFDIDLSIPADARPETDYSFLRELIGAPALERIENSLATFYRVYADMLRSSLLERPPQLLPNVREFLLMAREMGLTCIPFTGNAREPAFVKLCASNITELLDVNGGVYGDTLLTKLDVLSHLMSPLEKCVVFGDSIADVRAAKICGLPVVALATGWTTIDVLRQSAPDLTIERIPTRCKSLMSFASLVSGEGDQSHVKSLMDTDEPEIMKEYFDARADAYDNIHMRDDICWGREIRDIIAEFVPSSAEEILDLGAGTGIEIEGMLRRNHDVRIECVDLSPRMLSILKSKFSMDNVVAKECDFRNLDFSERRFDSVVSVMALHHLTSEEKLSLYRSVRMSLRAGGVFVNSDYILDEKVEQCVIAGIAEHWSNVAGKEGTYHIDRPLCEEEERRLLRDAGFCRIEKPYENKKAKVLVAQA